MMKKQCAVFVLFCLGISVSAVVYAEKAGKGPAVRQQQKTETSEYFQKQREENKKFKESLKDMTPEERKIAIKSNFEKRMAERKVFMDNQRKENTALLKEKLAANKNLTDDQKNELIAFFEAQQKENISYRDSQQAENVAFFEKTANDTSLTQEQKKEAMQRFHQTQQQENNQHRELQKSENKQEKGKIKTTK